MSVCRACGRPLTEGEAYKKVKLGGQTYLLCCPMCVTALEAGHVQRKMIPESFSNDRVMVWVEYLPALQVGGDYACVRSIREDMLYVIVGDVSGHGITSSLVMSHVGGEIEGLVEAGEDVANIAHVLNDRMIRRFEESLYLTLFCSAISLSSRTIAYTNCGHPPQLLWSHEDRRYHRLKSQNLPIGMFGHDVFGTPQKSTVHIGTGDKLLLFTDGILDLKSKEGSQLGESGLVGMFQPVIETPDRETEGTVFERIRTLQESQLRDDVLFVLVALK